MRATGGTDTDRLIDALDEFRLAMENNRAAAVVGSDPEALHDFRVGVRRTRSGLKHSAGVLPEKRRRRFQREFSELQAVTGPARDLQVWIAALPNDDPLRFVLAGHYDRAGTASADALSSRHTKVVLARWHQTLAKLPEGMTRVSAPKVIDEQRHRVLQAATAGPDAPSEELHRVRKRVKELRYVIELFEADETYGIRKPLKKLQNALGAVQDVAFQRAWLHEHAEEVGPFDIRMKELDEREHAGRVAYAEHFAALIDPHNTND